MRSLNEIRQELETAIEERSVLYDELADQHDPAKVAEAARLTAQIEALWDESRVARARARFGSPELIIARARAEEKLDRESRRLKQAA